MLSRPVLLRQQNLLYRVSRQAQALNFIFCDFVTVV